MSNVVIVIFIATFDIIIYNVKITYNIIILKKKTLIIIIEKK